MIHNYPLVRPDIPPYHEWIKELDSLYSSNQFTNYGRYWQSLNRKIESRFKDSSAIAVANNTVGQIAALQAHQVRGKIVMLSNFTFPATLQAVIQAGGIPCLLDVDMATGELGLDQIRKGIENFGVPKVVIFTRIFGNRNNLGPIAEYLNRQQINLVVDAAAGFPLNNNNTVFENMVEVFSFHATKALAVGEAGAVVGNSEIIQRILEATNFGFENSHSFADGSNAKLDEFACVRAITALDFFPEVAQRREQFVKHSYGDLLQDPRVRVFKNDGTWGWSLFPIRFREVNELIKFAEITSSLGLAGKRYYFPAMKAGYVGSAKVLAVENLTNSTEWSNATYCLPTYGRYTDEETHEISKIVNIALKSL